MQLPSAPPLLALGLTALVACAPEADANAGAPTDPDDQDFEAQYEALVEEFPEAFPDTTTLEALADRAATLGDRIRAHRMDNRDTMSDEEWDRNREIRSELRALRSVIRVVGQLSNSADVEIENFDLVNARLGLEPQVLETHESGLELVRIDVGSFQSWLLRNPTKKTVSVNYETNDPERPGGIGSASCESYSVMSGLFNSRDRDLESIELELGYVRDLPVGGCD